MPLTDEQKAERSAAFEPGFQAREEERWAEAAESFRSALVRWPRYVPGMICLAHVLRESDRWEEALDVYRRVIAIQPARQMLSTGFFFTALHLRRFDLTLEEARRFLPYLRDGLVEDASDDPDYHPLLESWVRDPLEGTPDMGFTDEEKEQMHIAFLPGRAEQGEGRHANAVLELQAALERWPRYWPGLNALGEALAELRRHEEAAEIYARGTKLWPRDERMSGGVFFQALEARRYDLATEEAKRFLPLLEGGGIGDADYHKMLVEWLEHPLRSAARWARGKKKQRRRR